MTEINFMDYLRVRTSVNLYVKNNKIDDNFTFEQPVLPSHLEILFKSKSKWERDLELTLNEQIWRIIFKICFKSVCDNTIVWFQYKIIHRILGTNKYLNLISKSESSSCRLCNNSEESLIHLFVECPKSLLLWQSF